MLDVVKLGGEAKKLKLKPGLGLRQGASAAFIGAIDESKVAAEYSAFPEQILAAAKSGAVALVHSHGNLELVSRGGALLSRGEFLPVTHSSLLKIRVGSEIESDTHVFLVGEKGGVANAYVHHYDEKAGVIYVGAMSSALIEL